MNRLADFLMVDDVRLDGRTIKVVRDDVFPFIGGGAKARKAVYYETDLQKEGYNAVVTCGGIQSNHNRAMALLAARHGWKCHLCIQGTEERFMREKGNALLDRLSGAECEFITPKETSVAMDRAMDRFREQGLKPYYVTGGGHDLPGGIAFVEAVRLLKQKCEEIGYKPDYIFHASGTGSTQAGIAVGLDLVGWSDVRLTGISVARQQERGRKVIVDCADGLAEHYGLEKDYCDSIHFNTDYLFGGYEKYSEEMSDYLRYAMRQTGLVFDTTYSGKAFYGMMDMLGKDAIQGNVLFWHTGGIMNL